MSDSMQPTVQNEEDNTLSFSDYIETLKEWIDTHPDGSWQGSDEHQALFSSLTADESALQSILSILQTEPRLTLRYEALRAGAAICPTAQLVPALIQQTERAGYRPLMGRRYELALQLWSTDEAPKRNAVEDLRTNVQAQLWFGPPQPEEDTLRATLSALADLGEPGCFGIARLLREQLEEPHILGVGCLQLFSIASDIFVEAKYFEGVQVFFDFLSDCKPTKPGRDARKAVGAVLKAVRTLRPYRYPQWARPLGDFIQHYRSIGRKGRAAEANMLMILITATSLEDALLLEDDELVDLLRGRRDAAYTDEELEDVVALCDDILAAGRRDCRMYHIRGWLAARLNGPDAAEPFFLQALEINPEYVYSHLALSYIYQQWGEDELREHHLASACDAPETLISCQRQYGEVLQRADEWDTAAYYYERGTHIQPEQASVFELEEFFGCFAALAHLYAESGQPKKAQDILEEITPSLVQSRFGARFCSRNQVIVDLLQKGLQDVQAEYRRMA